MYVCVKWNDNASHKSYRLSDKNPSARHEKPPLNPRAYCHCPWRLLEHESTTLVHSEHRTWKNEARSDPEPPS